MEGVLIDFWLRASGYTQGLPASPSPAKLIKPCCSHFTGLGIEQNAIRRPVVVQVAGIRTGWVGGGLVETSFRQQKPTKGNNSYPLIKNNMTAIKLNLLPKCRQAAESLPLALPPSLLLRMCATVSLSLFENYDLRMNGAKGAGSQEPGARSQAETTEKVLAEKENE